jgi:hypothetical protein
VICFLRHKRVPTAKTQAQTSARERPRLQPRRSRRAVQRMVASSFNVSDNASLFVQQT